MSVSPAEDWIIDAAAGRLPPWTEAGPKRRAHMERVATLMGQWATELGLGDYDRLRWQAAGWLHDTLRGADGETLRPELDPPFDTLPASYLHGPATVSRLEKAGARDRDVLAAIRYHTLGDARLSRLGLALIAADYLEPGRPAQVLWRTRMRTRMPHAFEEVLRAVVHDKLRRGMAREDPLRPEMVGLWNWLAERA